MVEPASRRALLRLARATIANHGLPEGVDLPDDPELRAPRGAFVSLHDAEGAVRGCVGTTAAVQPLVDAVTEMAVAAAERDPRFPPVEADELETLEIEISVLGPMESVEGLEQVEPGRHGLMAQGYGRRGLLLPQVASEQGWDATTFAEHTCLKAGLPPEAYHDPDVQLFRFTAEVFNETAELPDGSENDRAP